MKWAVAVTTAPREQAYLEETLGSLARAGWTDPIIWAEPGTEIPPSARGLRIVQNGHRLGPLSSFRAALKGLAEAVPDADAYAVFEDDIAVTSNLRRWLERDGLWPSCRVGVVSLYTASENAEAKSGWHRCLQLPTQAIGALAYVFPPDSAREIAVTLSGVSAWNRVDYWVGRCCLRAQLEYWMHSPSFVRHTGAISSIHDLEFDERRQCANFVPEISALPF